jgi:hypothetical protein
MLRMQVDGGSGCFAAGRIACAIAAQRVELVLIAVPGTTQCDHLLSAACCLVPVLLQLLAGACELLGSTFNLNMNFTAAPAGTSWCEEAYVITVADAQPQQAAAVSSYNQTEKHSGVGATAAGRGISNSNWNLGQLLLLFDPHYDGLPHTSSVRWVRAVAKPQFRTSVVAPGQTLPYAGRCSYYAQLCLLGVLPCVLLFAT